jgi:hypothetical protein
MKIDDGITNKKTACLSWKSFHLRVRSEVSQTRPKRTLFSICQIHRGIDVIEPEDILLSVDYPKDVRTNLPQ